MMQQNALFVLAAMCAAGILPAEEPMSKAGGSEPTEDELVARVRQGLMNYATALDGVSYHVVATKYQYNSLTRERTCNSQDGVVAVLGGLTQWKGQTFMCTEKPPTRLYGGKVTALLAPEYIAWHLPKSPTISRMMLTGDPSADDDIRSHWSSYAAEIHSQPYDALTSPEHGIDAAGVPTLVSRFLDDAPRHGVKLRATRPADRPDIVLITAEDAGRGTSVAEFQLRGSLACKTSFTAHDGQGRLRSRSTVTYLPHTFAGKGDIPLPEAAQVVYWNPIDDAAVELDRTLEVNMTADSWSFGEISTDPKEWLESRIGNNTTPVEDYGITANGLIVIKDSSQAEVPVPSATAASNADTTIARR